jgi:AbrB family looped-hinge helix DNA binding protein
MRTTITTLGQTIVPAAIRREFGLYPEDRLEWLIDQDGIRVVPVTNDPIRSFRAQGKDRIKAVSRLLAERAKDNDKQNAKDSATE